MKSPPESSSVIVPLERIQQAIYLFRSERVMLDADLATLYGVPTKALIQAMKRNAARFPVDFAFQLTLPETGALRSQIVTSNAHLPRRGGRSRAAEPSGLRSQFVTSKTSRGGRRYLPYAFTEQGVAMLSSVLRSRRAAEVNVAIMRAFVALRRLLADHTALARKLAALERRYAGHDVAISSLFDAIRELVAPAKVPRREIGFHTLPALRLATRRAK